MSLQHSSSSESSEDGQEVPPIIRALATNNQTLLSQIITKHGPDIINSKYLEHDPALHFAIATNKLPLFDYLTNFKGVDLNITNHEGQTPLITALQRQKPQFAIRLIAKGADVNFTDSDLEYSPLHYALCNQSSRNLNIPKLLLEKGAQADSHVASALGSILNTACMKSTEEDVCMILYYGAVAGAPNISDLPLTTAMVYQKRNWHLHEILFEHTFDSQDGQVLVNLDLIMTALVVNSPLFPRILDKTSEIVFEPQCFPYINRIAESDPKYFKMLLKMFPEVIKTLLRTHSELLTETLTEAVEGRISIYDFLRFLDGILESDLAADFVLTFDPTIDNIGHIIKLSSQHKIPAKNLTGTLCSLLSYGLTLDVLELDSIYNYYGFCELFEILLYMDSVIVKPPERLLFNFPRFVMPFMITSVGANLRDFLKNPLYVKCGLRYALKYFSDSLLKQMCLDRESDFVSVKDVMVMPRVASLVELARDAARLYIVKRYEVGSCGEFYRVLHRLPIASVHRDIISFRIALYELYLVCT